MNSRERVLTALNHKEPDRVPLFIGTSGATTVVLPGYEKLKNHLGIREGQPRLLSAAMQYAWMDEEVMVRLASDGRVAAPGAMRSAFPQEISANRIVDGWGCVWERREGELYFEVKNPPLGDVTLDGLNRYPWPDLTHPARFECLAERCRAIQQAGYACVLLTGVTLFEQIYVMRGLENCLVDLAADQDFFAACIAKMKSLMIPYVQALLQEAGPYVDVIITGDDLGSQESTLMAPDTYRRLIKPHHAELFAAIKEKTAANIFFHSDGNIHPLLGDLVDVGVDLLNPVQVSSGTMGDTARLKREFGDRLSFCGAIDTQHVLPHGTTGEVRAEVRHRIRDLAPGGGYVAASVHCIQSDVPPENIVAMCEEVTTAGRYPLRV